MSQRWMKNGAPFTPAGANIIDEPGGSVRTFDVGYFNAVNYDARLHAMQSRGYNAVRQFAWMPSAASGTGSGLSDAYMANVATGIQLAYACGLFTILSIGGIPGIAPTDHSSGSGGYFPTTLDAGYTTVNQNWLHLTTNGTTTALHALGDGLAALSSHGVTADMLLAIEFTGEIGYLLTAYPLNQTGSIATPSGTYTLPGASQAMMDANILRFISAMHGVSKQHFPITPTMVQLNPANGLVDATIAVPSAAICATPAAMDAIGLSLYPETFPNTDISFATLIANLGAALPQSKYLTIIEFGYTTAQAGSLATLAENLAASWIPAACAYGIHGYSFFTWDVPQADTTASLGVAYYNMLDGNAEFASALSPSAIGDGCGGGKNADLAPVLATNRAIAKFWAPGLAPEANPPTVTLTNITDWRGTLTQANQFDGHQLTIAETDARQIRALPNRTHVIIEHLGIGDIGWGIVEVPSQQVRATGEGTLILSLPNVTTEAANVLTGMGYLAQGAIKDLVNDIGGKKTKGRSDFANPAVPYDAQNRAVTKVTEGRTTPWSAVFIDDGTYQDATAPVVWDNPGNATADGNSVTRTSGFATPIYDGSGANGTPGNLDVGHRPCQLTWQIVVPTVAQVGLRSDRAIGSPDYGFDFSAPAIDPLDGQYKGVFTCIAGRAGNGVSGQYRQNSKFAVSTFFSNGTLSIRWLFNGQTIYQNTYNFPGAFYPVANIAALGGQVSNVQFTRNVPSGETWYQVQYDKKSVPAALIQTASDLGIIVRQGVNIDGSPKRSFEVGNFGDASGVSLRGGGYGVFDRIRVNKNVRLIQEILDYSVDSSNCYTVTTPLGGGSDDAQVDLELLWRILNDVTYDHFQNTVGGYLNVFPEYDPSFTIWRDGGNGKYEYYVVAEEAFAPVGYAYWMDNKSYVLPSTSIGYIDGGPTALSQFTYPQEANLAEKEGVARLLYVSTIEQLKRAMVPHITVRLTTIGDWRPPRAGQRVHIDYARSTTTPSGDPVRSGSPFSPDRILTGTDPVTNPDPMVLKVERAAGSKDVPIDTWLLSNLGKYPDTPESQMAAIGQQVAAIQLSSRNNISSSHLNIAYENIDADHPIYVPCYFLRQVFSVDAFFLFIYTLPFSQPIAPDGNSDLYFNDPNTPIRLKVDLGDVPLPLIDDLNTLEAQIPDLPHEHAWSIGKVSKALNIPSVPYNNAPDAYLWMAESGNLAQVFSNGHQGSVYTSTGLKEADFSKTAHPHEVAKKNDVIIHLPQGTAVGNLPQHYHPLPPGIKELTRPSGITLSIAGPDGVYQPVTANLIDVLTNTPPGATGFSSQVFMVEIAKQMNWPGRLPIIRIESMKDANNGRGRVGYGGTIYESIGGLGSTVFAKQ